MNFTILGLRVWLQACCKTTCLIMLSFKHVEKTSVWLCCVFKNVENQSVLLRYCQHMWGNACVLMCFLSSILKNHWFYWVVCQKGWKTIGFTKRLPTYERKCLYLIMLCFKHVEKPLVLLYCLLKSLKNHWFYLAIAHIHKTTLILLCFLWNMLRTGVDPKLAVSAFLM